ncbi:MAG: ribonuclease Y [Chloroflexi bacterium]|jgi:ribonuclease Y|nr:ribonuclease Y [Chloroflexota bacterium]
MEIVLALIGGLAIGVGLGAAVLYAYQNMKGTNRQRQAEEEAARVVNEAQNKARQIEVEAKDAALRIQQDAEENAKKRRIEIDRESDRLQKRREDLDTRYERLELREQNLNKRQSKLDKRQNDIQIMYEEQRAVLESVAEMTRDQAREELLTMVETETRQDMARRIREVEEEAKVEAENRARDIIALAIQRIASDHINEIAVSVVNLPSDEMKGRVIGRNGRNIRAFEQATGVDVVVDDTPEAITISSFDPVRREVAKRAMSKLVLDGRIHPARIEKLVSDSRKEVERVIREEGERAAYEAGVPGLNNEILKLLGRLKFRTSYGQNQHAHAIETAHIAGMIAAELGADVAIAKAGGLLHDIGKAVDHEIEGTHASIGADFARRYGLPPKVVNAIASHHHEVEQESVEAMIIEAADAISGARPGARRESLDTYIRRVKALEDLAREFEGVEQSYALQAGREVRIMVKPEEIDDLAAMRLARDISKRIEETMQYPGQIKVTIIRETRAVDYAK